MIRTLPAAAAVLAGVLGLASAPARANEPIVVAELFTSQGCSSCPPADLVLHALAERPEVLALSLPVTYWDYLGWEDTFARDDHVARQRRYSALLERSGRVYTPQLVVNGTRSLVGSRDGAVRDAVAASARDAARAVRFTRDEATGGTQVTLLEEGPAPRAEVILVRYRPGRSTADVRRGENAGRRLSYTNVVTDMVPLGVVRAGETVEFSPPAPAEDGVESALLIQTQDQGPILAALRLEG